MHTTTLSRSLALLVLAAVTTTLGACASGGAGARRTLGALVYDGIPKIDLDARARQYFESRSASFLDWDENGQGLYVSTRFAESTQLHHVAAPGAARRQLTFAKEPIYAASAWTGAKKGVVYRKDAGGNEAYQYYFLDRESGETRLITDGKSRNDGWLSFRGVSGVPGSGKAIVTSTKRNGTDADVYLVEGDAPQTPRLIAEVKGRVYPMAWNKEGTLALVMRYVQITETYLYVLDIAKGTMTPLEASPPAGSSLAGQRAVRKIARGAARFSPLDSDVVYFTSDEGGDFLSLYKLKRSTGQKELLTPTVRWDVTSFAISPDGQTLVYKVNENGQTAIYVAPIDKPGEAKRVDVPLGTIDSLRFDPRGGRVAFSLTSPTSPMDVYTLDVKSGSALRWTESELGGLDVKRFASPELVKFPSFDGRDIPAWYYRARNVPAGQKAPVLISIHGGPESQATVYFSPYVQYLVAELGISVLVPNVRGSSGYGKSYVKLDDGFNREDSVKDIGALLDFIAQRPELDASRVAVFGGSYGGYMVLASLVHHGKRLRCGVDIVGISNFVTFLENTKSYRRDLRRVEYGDERDPKMREFLHRISPTTNASKITKPLFVVQGANDPRVPDSEAEQIVKAVRKSGRPVWYLLAKDEGHGFRKKTNIVALLESVGAFLRAHLLPIAPTPGAPAPAPVKK